MRGGAGRGGDGVGAWRGVAATASGRGGDGEVAAGRHAATGVEQERSKTAKSCIYSKSIDPGWWLKPGLKMSIRPGWPNQPGPKSGIGTG